MKMTETEYFAFKNKETHEFEGKAEHFSRLRILGDGNCAAYAIAAKYRWALDQNSSQFSGGMQSDIQRAMSRTISVLLARFTNPITDRDDKSNYDDLPPYFRQIETFLRNSERQEHPRPLFHFLDEQLFKVQGDPQARHRCIAAQIIAIGYGFREMAHISSLVAARVNNNPKEIEEAMRIQNDREMINDDQLKLLHQRLFNTDIPIYDENSVVRHIADQGAGVGTSTSATNPSDFVIFSAHEHYELGVNDRILNASNDTCLNDLPQVGATPVVESLANDSNVDVTTRINKIHNFLSSNKSLQVDYDAAFATALTDLSQKNDWQKVTDAETYEHMEKLIDNKTFESTVSEYAKGKPASINIKQIKDLLVEARLGFFADKSDKAAPAAETATLDASTINYPVFGA